MRPRSLREGARRQLLPDAQIVAEGRHHDCGQILARLGNRRVKAGNVVVGEMEQVRPVFRGHTDQRGRAPRHRAMISASRHQHLATSGARACEGDAGGHGIRAVLLKQRPVGMGDGRHQLFRQHHRVFGRPVEAVARIELRARRRFHFGMAVAKDDRAPAAHEVDITAPVHVAHPRAFAAGKELRIAGRHRRCAHMSPHSSWNHMPRARSQQRITCGGGIGHLRLRFAAGAPCGAGQDRPFTI